MEVTRTMGLLCSLLCAATLDAQTFGEITGTVTDPSGAIITGTTVVITNTATRQVRRAVTNDAGHYTAPFLVPGIYDVQAESGGFKQATRRGVDLQVGAVVRIDFSLEIGGVAETVEVAGGAPLLATENTAVGTVIENRRIVELPLNGRNYLQLVALTTNVTHEMQSGGRYGAEQGGERVNQPISVAGQRQQYNRYTLDGVENTDPGYNTFVVRPSIDALQEFKVQTGVYSAEYGRAVSQINVTTKPGSNQFHGTVFEFLRNSALDAKEWLQQGQKNPFRRNQFGFTLGGRLIRDKLFFMSNYEGLRDVKTTQAKANVATDRMRAGDFSGQSRPILDPLSRVFTPDAQGNPRAVSATPFPGNAMPQSRLDPIALKLLEFYPRAVAPGDNILSNFVRQRPTPNSWDQFTQRIDFNENSNSNWFGRFSWGDEFAGGLADFKQQEGSTNTKVYQTMLSNTRTLGATIVNEFRFGYNQFQNGQLLHFAYTRDVTKELGIVGLVSPVSSAWGTPLVSLGNGLTGFGEPFNGPYVNRNHTFQWLDNLAVVHGNHSLKFGGEVRRDRYNELGNSFWRGNFGFDGSASFDPASRGTSGHAFADFLLGDARAASRSLGIANAMFRTTSFAVYFEDTWRITSRFTLNAGLRYENTPPFHDKYRGIVNAFYFDPGVGPQGLLRGTRVPVLIRPGKGDFYDGVPFHFQDGIPTQVGDDILGRALVRHDNNDFAPRVGFSYSPTSRWSLRSGFGAFYSQDVANPRFDMARNLASRNDFNSSQEQPNAFLSDPWRFQRETSQCSGWSGTCFGTPTILSDSVYRRTPYAMQWVLNVQRELFANTALEIGYQGSASHKMERFRNWNDPIMKSGPNDASSILQRRPWPVYGVMFNVDGIGNANYNALNTKLQRRFSRGLTYLIGFTWSKAIDDASAIRNSSGDHQSPPNSYDIHPERALSQFHTGRRMVSSFVYELPFGANKPLLNRSRIWDKLVGGWQLSSIVTFSDGTPVNVGGIGDRNNTGSGNFPDATGVSPFPNNQSVSNFWNIAAFNTTNPELNVRYGNAGRNILLTPGVRQWDFSLLKNTAIRESHMLQFRFEAFNFSNHPNWNSPAGDATSAATFGKITSARTMREMQFGLKYVF